MTRSTTSQIDNHDKLNHNVHMSGDGGQMHHQMDVNGNDASRFAESRSISETSGMEANMSSLRSHVFTRAPAIASSRYNRQMLIPSISVPGQAKIAKAKVLIVGLGGLGSPASLYLAGAGVGKLGLLDDDTVEETNLHRQIVHRESSVENGMTKVDSAARGCCELNSTINIVPHAVRLDISSRENAEHILQIMSDYDIVLDCTDNPATRYLLNDLCVVLSKTLVSGAAQRLEGQLMVLNYSINGENDTRGPCYRCVFPTPPEPDMVKGCGEIGILGPVVGTIGTLMATEALRLIVKGEKDVRKPSMLLYNAWPTDPRGMFRTIGLRGKRFDCVACGDPEQVRAVGKTIIERDSIVDGSLDYVAFCGGSGNIRLLSSGERVDAEQFLDGVTNINHPSSECRMLKNPIAIDVRERYEIEMGTKLNIGVNIPISTIMRQEDPPEQLKNLLNNSQHSAILFICQRGNDSQVAAKKLLNWRSKQSQELGPDNAVFIGDVVGGLTAVEKYDQLREPE